MSEHLQEHLDLCAAYALGCLDAPDRDTLEVHLATGCAACEAALVEFSAATTLLAAATPPLQPPPELRQRVLDAARAATASAEPWPGTARRTPVAAVVPLTPRRSTARWAWLAAAACLAVAVWGVRTTRQLRAQIETQQTRLVALEHDRDQLASQLDATRRWVEVATANDARASPNSRLLPAPTRRCAAGQCSIPPPSGRRSPSRTSGRRPDATTNCGRFATASRTAWACCTLIPRASLS